MRNLFKLATIIVVIFVVISSIGSVKAEYIPTISEFSPQGLTHDFRGITNGPDGNLWYTAYLTDGTTRIGKVTTNGVIEEFPITGYPTTSDQFVPYDIANGSDGNLWVTGYLTGEGYKIGRISPSGTILGFFNLPTNSSTAYRLTKGSDDNLWFTQPDPAKIGRITPNGLVTEFAIPDTSTNYRRPESIVSGGDGNIWFTLRNTSNGSSSIAKITMSGDITEYPITQLDTELMITSGSDGHIWFTEVGAKKIGKITTDGNVTKFNISSGNIPWRITPGPDNNLWFTEVNSEFIGKISYDGVITEYPITITGGQPDFITKGSDDNLWFTEVVSNTKIGRINLIPLTPTPTPTPKPEFVYSLSGTAVDHNQVPLDRLELSVSCGNSIRKTKTNRQGGFRVALSTKSNCLVGSVASITATRNGINGSGTAIVQKNSTLGIITISLLTDMEKKVLAAIEWANNQALKDQTRTKNNYFKKCLAFVQDAWKSTGIDIGKGGNPISYWKNYPKHFERHTWTVGDTSIPPAGALVIWDKNDWNREDGHVALSLGDGNVISTWAKPYPNGNKADHSIFIFSIYNSSRDPITYNLLGWIMPK